MKFTRYITVTVNGVKKVDEPVIIADGEYKQVQEIISEYKKKGYKHVCSSLGGPTDWYVYSNEKEGKAVNIKCREHFNVTDRKGRKIYFDSVMRFVFAKTTAPEFLKDVYGYEEPKAEFNRWTVHAEPERKGIYIEGRTGWEQWFGYTYTRRKIKSLDFFKNFEVIE